MKITNNKKEKFGRFPCGKKYKVRYCIDCNKEIKQRDAKRCKSCSHKGERNINWIGGWKNSLPNCQVCNRKLSRKDAHYCLEHRPNRDISGDKNPAKRPEVRAKMSKAGKGKILSQEWKDKISDSMKGKHAGNKNPGFIHGNSRKNREARRELKHWRKGVFERDSYTCQECEQHGGELNAHHIRSFANNKELRLNIDNGITLCKDCHKKLHNNYNF